MAYELNYGQPLAGQSVGDVKKQQVADASAAKQQELDPAAAYNKDLASLDPVLLQQKYGDKAVVDQLDYKLGAAQSQRMDNWDRSAGEVTSDTGLSVAKGAVGLGGFLSSFARMAGQGMAVTGQNWNDPEQALKNLHAVEVGNARSAAAQNQSINNANDALTQALSRRSQLAETRTNADIQDRQQQNTAQYDADVKAGASPLVAGLEQLGRGFVDGASAVAKDPTYLSNFVAQQVPSLALGPASAVAARAEVAAGLTGSAARDLLKSELGKAAVQKAGTRNLMASIGITEGAGAGQQTFDQVNQTSFDDLQKHSQDYRDLIAQGNSPEDARAVVAQRSANAATLIQTPAAALAGRIAAKFELAPLSGGGATGAARVGHALMSTLKETGEETLQSGGGQLAQNVGVKSYADDTQSLSDGVGEQAGMGALGAVGLTTAVQAPSAAAGVAKVTARQTADMAKQAAGFSMTKLRDIAEKRTALNPEDQAAADAQTQSESINTAAQEYAQAQPQAATDEQATEEAPAAPEDTRIGKLAQLNQFLSHPQAPEAQKRDLVAKAVVQMGNMVNEYKAMGAEVEADPDADHTVTLGKMQAMEKAFASPEFQNIIAHQQHYAQNPIDVAAADEAIPEQVGTATPEMQQHAKDVADQAAIEPEKIPEPLYQKVISNGKALGLNPQQIAQVQGGLKVAQLSQTKGIDMVNKDVTEGGNAQFMSLKDHVKGVYAGLAANDMQSAQNAMTGLQAFAQHMASKAADFDAAYDRWQANPAAGPVSVTRADGSTYNSLVTAGQQAKPMFASGKSSVLMAKIRNEAKLLADTYNQMLSDHPELSGSPILLAPAPQQQQAQPVASPKPAAPVRESTTGTGVFNGERELTRAEMQDLASGEVTIADLKQKWADEAAPAPAVQEPVAEAAPEPAPSAEPVPQESVPVQPEPTPVESPAETRDNVTEPLSKADPVTANPEPVTPQTDEAGEPQNEPSEPSEPVADREPAGEPVVAEEDTQTGAERLLANLTPRLNRERTEKESEADHEARVSNAVVKWFAPAKARTPFSRTLDFMSKLGEALRTSADATGELLGLKDGEQLTQENMDALETLTYLNDRFRDEYAQAIAAKLAKVKDLNALPWRNSPILYFTRVSQKGELRSHQTSRHATDAIGMAALKFALDNLNATGPTSREDLAEDLNISADQITDAMMERFMTGSQAFSVVAGRLAASITRTMGLKASDDAPGNIANGIPLSLAMDALNVLQKLGLAKIDSLKMDVGTADAPEIKTFKSVSFVNDEGSALRDIDAALGSQLDLLSRMIDPESKASAYIDALPPVGGDRLGRSQVQKLSSRLKDTVRNLQKKAFYLNTDLHDLVEGMGFDAVGKMLGIRETDNLNRMHAESVEGKNVSIRSALASWQRGMSDLQAKAGDRNLGDIPVRFAWSIGSNMRAMLNSTTFNPQRHKFHRELMTGEPRAITLGDKKQVHQFQMAVAQAMGVKVDRMSNAAAKAKAAEKLADPTVAAAVDTLKAHLGDYSGLTASDVGVITAAVGIAGEGMKSFHGLLAQAKFLHAQENGATSFMNHLTFELDGKTDGPANALVHFGSARGDSTFFNMLKKVGLFVNDASTALNVFSAGDSDIYQEVSARINNVLKAANPDNMEPGAVRAMKGQLRLLQLAGNIEIADPDDIKTATATRNMAKNPVTQTVYSAGDDAKVRSLSKQMQTAVYEELSKALAQGTQLDQSIVDAVESLTGNTALRDPANYQGFRFSPNDNTLMENHLTTGMGAVLNTAIGDVLGNVVTSGQTLAKAAAVQHQFFAAAFTKARQTKLDALRAAGELSGFEDLSAAQVQEVYDSVVHLAPIYHNALTSGTNPRDGMLMSKEVRDNFTGQRAESVFGDKTDIPALNFEAPGARPAPMMTISSGDATMMALYFLKHDNALNVFDGLEVMPGEFDAAAKAINEAVFQGWQFGLMSSIAESYEAGIRAVTPDLFSGLSVAELGNMARNLRIPAKQLKGLDAGQLMTRIMQEAEGTNIDLSDLATNIDATKSVIFNELPTSTDHMAGHEQPVINRADIAPVTDPVTQVASRANAYRMRKRKAEDLQLSQNDTALDRHLKAVNPGKGDPVTVFTKDQVLQALKGYLDEVAGKKARIPQFVLSQIEKQLPDDLSVHIGTPQNIRSHILAQFPDLGSGTLDLVQGMTYGNTVFIGNRSAETILHELVHAATQNVIDQYFSDATRLSPEQRSSIGALNRILTDFLSEEAAGLPVEQRRFGKSGNVQQYLQMLVTTGDRTTALKEFVAWSMTNPWLAADLQAVENTDKSTHILGRILKVIARMLGIGTAAQSYFTSIAGHVQQAMGPAYTRDVTGTATALNQLDLDGLFARLRSERTTVSHQAHLDQVFANLKQNLIDRITTTAQPVAGIKTAADQLDLDAIDPAISQSAAQFMASGYPMNAQEEMVFKMLQASLSTAFEAHPARAIEARKLFNEAAQRLTPADFGLGPMGQMRYDALFGQGQHADTQLANFLAVAQVNQQLRDALRQMFVKRSSQRSQNWEERITKSVDDAIRWVANLGTGIRRSTEVQKRLDILTKNLTHFEAQAKQNVIEKATSGIGDSLDQLNNVVNQKKANGAAWLEANAEQLAQKVPNAVAQNYAEFLMRGVAAMGSKGASSRFAEALTSTINQGDADTPLGPLRSLVVEMMGVTDSNRATLELVSRAKTSVDKVRQIIREQVPKILSERFSAPLSQQESAALHAGLGKTDAASLLKAGYSHTDVQRLFADQAYLVNEISNASAAIVGPHAASQRLASYALAHFMVTGEVTNSHLLTNAYQIANLTGTGIAVQSSDAKANQPALDKLVSLLAISKLPAQQKSDVAAVMAREEKANPGDNGATFSLNYLNNLREREDARLNAMNGIKGAMHTTFDAHKSVVIATAAQGAELLKRGYIKGAMVQGDPQANHGVMHYYESSEGGRPQWNQGAMQTVQVTAGGVDPYTGRMITPVSTPRLQGGTQVSALAAKRRQQARTGRAFMPNGNNMNLRPVFDINGATVAYEYSVPHDVRDAKLEANTDFGHNLGVWEGRIQEELLSQGFNQKLVEVLHDRYTEDMKTTGRDNEYIAINAKSKDPQVREMYGLMPVEMKAMVENVFGGDLMVRKDMLDNALGFRRASVKEIWDGNSRLNAGAQSAVKAVSEVVMGKSAARYLRKGERFLQEAVSSAKDWIVVRSLVVARDNIVSNVTQMLSHGMNPLQVARKSAEAMVLVDAYQKNERRMNELSLLIQNGVTPAKHPAFNRELESLRAENARNPVHPLVMAGHLPTIAEGLSENDDYSMRNDFNGWVERQTAKLPKGVTTAARYALIARGTPLYAGLNRMIQYGDFTAKYALYDHLMTRKSDKMDQQGALQMLEDEFVNYALLPSRSRDYLESMGATWFLNYKLRIQKILLRSMRDNPLRFLAIAGGFNAADVPNVLDANLVTNSVSPNLGMGALFRAHETHPLWWLID